MKNFANVCRFAEVWVDDELLGIANKTLGDYVLYEDYEELLNAYRTLIDKMSEVVGDAAFEE